MAQIGVVSYNADEAVETRSVYYSGEDTLPTGAVLCYKHDAEVGADDRKLQRGVNVVKPATANLMYPAGILDPRDAGKTGPCYVRVIVPRRGSFVTALVKANATGGATMLAPENDSYALAAHAGANTNTLADNEPCIAVATETANTSSEAATKLVALR